MSGTEWNFGATENFSPNVFVDISQCMDKKLKALEIYCDEMRDSPHTRSIKNVTNLAGLRGAAVGVKYAEAFKALRIIK